MKKPRKPFRSRYGTQADMALRMAARLERIADTNRPIDSDSANTLELKMTEAIAAITAGEATLDHMSCLAAEISLCARMCEVNFGGSLQYLDVALAARDALEAAGKRHLRLKKWGLAGPELQAMRDFIALRSAQYNHEDNTVGIERAIQADVEAAIRKGNFVRFMVEDDRKAVAA